VTDLEFLAEQSGPLESRPSRWKVLVVDDAAEVLTITRLALQGFTYEGRGLTLLEAPSADAARAILTENDDIAVILLDVVMETDHAGLDLVRWIRKERRNPLIRILIRTGQAGQFPAAAVITEYDINDYWEKTELTFSRLQSSLMTSLRGYDDLLRMHRRTLQLRQWADRFPDLLGVRDWNSLLRLVMLRLRELFPETVLSAFLCRNDGRRWPLISGTGAYPAHGAPDVLDYIDERKATVLLDAWDRKALSESVVAQALYFEASSGGHLFFIELPAEWDDYERNVTRLVLQNFRAALENRTLINDLEAHRTELAALLHRQEDITRDLHHRYQESLQVVLSFIEIESRDRTGVSTRTPLAGVQRRLHVLALLHSLLQQGRRLSSLDFQTLLQTLVTHGDRQTRASDPGVEYWGVPLEVGVEAAVPLALATVEMIDLVMAPSLRAGGSGPVQLMLSDNPRRLSVSRQGVSLSWTEPGPLEWQLLGKLADQLSGTIQIENNALVLSF
jgi:two-component sensor histidine kinase/CheY-like chemotaxis protein